MDKKKTYSEKLRDPRWQKKRLEILNRDGWKCQKCGDEKSTLHIHHSRYVGEPWDAPNNNLITLCRDCHSVIEEWELNSDDYKALKFTNEHGNSLLVSMHRNQLFLYSVNGPDTHLIKVGEDKFQKLLEFINKNISF